MTTTQTEKTTFLIGYADYIGLSPEDTAQWTAIVTSLSETEQQNILDLFKDQTHVVPTIVHNAIKKIEYLRKGNLVAIERLTKEEEALLQRPFPGII